MRKLVFSLLLFAFIFTAAFLFTIAGERVGAVEDSQGLSRFAEPETVKTASFSGGTCSRQGCINRYYWWWKVSGKPESEFAKDYWFPCWLGCVNGG